MLLFAIAVEIFLGIQATAYLIKADLSAAAMAKISYAMLGIVELICLIMLVSYTVIWDSLSRIQKLMRQNAGAAQPGSPQIDKILKFFGMYIGILVIFFAGIIATFIRTLNAVKG